MLLTDRATQVPLESPISRPTASASVPALLGDPHSPTSGSIADFLRPPSSLPLHYPVRLLSRPPQGTRQSRPEPDFRKPWEELASRWPYSENTRRAQRAEMAEATCRVGGLGWGGAQGPQSPRELVPILPLSLVFQLPPFHFTASFWETSLVEIPTELPRGGHLRWGEQW